MIRGPRSGKVLYLTFDDGPHPEFTPQVLEVLSDMGVQATFFFVGEQAKKHPGLVKQVASEGHEIGNHTWSHADPRILGTRRLLDEVRRTSDLLADLTGKAVTLFRPPHGKVSARQFFALLVNGYTVALWNIDTKDYSCSNLASVESRLQKWLPTGGDIVLLHDRLPHAAATTRWIAERAVSLCPSMTLQSLSTAITRTVRP